MGSKKNYVVMQMYFGYNKVIYVCKLQLLVYTIRTCIMPESKNFYQSSLKLKCGQTEYVGKYSSSDASAQKKQLQSQ